MDASLQLKKQRTNKHHSKSQSVLYRDLFFEHNKWKVSSLTLVWHNQGEVFHHSCQQLHHSLYVLSAEEIEITSAMCFVRKRKITAQAARKRKCS